MSAQVEQAGETNRWRRILLVGNAGLVFHPKKGDGRARGDRETKRKVIHKLDISGLRVVGVGVVGYWLELTPWPKRKIPGSSSSLFSPVLPSQSPMKKETPFA